MSLRKKLQAIRLGLVLGAVAFGVGIWLGQGHDVAADGPPWAAAWCMVAGGILITLGFGGEIWRKVFGDG